MAILQKAYQGYRGTQTSPFERIAVIFRYGLADVFRRRMFVAFFSISLLLPVALMCFIYGYHNLESWMTFEAARDKLPVIDGHFFATAMQIPHNFLLLVMVVAIGPAMISPDLCNNAMPLYLSRPINKASYILGKLSVLVFLGSLITWVPALALIFLQAFLAGDTWLADNFHLFIAAMITSLSWVVTLSLIAFAVSSLIKWRAVARLVFFGLIFVGFIVGELLEETLGGSGVYVINLYAGVEALTTYLFQADRKPPGFLPGMNIEFVLMQFLAFVLAALFIITRRIRAFHMVP